MGRKGLWLAMECRKEDEKKRTIRFPNKINGPLFVFLGAFFWSLNAPLVKFINLNPFLVAGLRSLIAGIALSPFLNFRKLNFNKWTVAYILSYAGLCIAVILALSRTSATIAIGMQFSSVIWIFLLNCIRSKKISIKSLYSVIPITLGIILFILSSNSSGTMSGNIIALSEGLFFTGVTVFVKKANTKNTLGLISLANIFTALMAFLIMPSSVDFINIGSQNLILVLVLGLVQMALGYSFYTYGVIHTSNQKAAIISVWEMILGPLWVAIFLREIPNLMVFVGFIFILIGMVVEALVGVAKEKQKI